MTGLILEPFGGIGGFGEALAMHGRTSLSVELEPWAVAMSRANGHLVVQHDVVTYPYLAHLGQTEGIAGGPPCQGFSAAGKGDGRHDVPLILDTARQMFELRALGPEVGMALLRQLSKNARDHRSHLVLVPWLWFLHLDPDWMVLEQVPKVLVLWELLRDLARSLGRGAYAAKVCAEQYGVPQTRRRAVLLIHRHRTDSQLVPTPTHSRYYERDKTRLDLGVPRWVTMAQALGWGANGRPSFTVTGGGTAAGGAEPFGRRAREAMDEAQDAGEWVVRTGQNSRQAGGTAVAYERETMLPAPTITGQARSWTLGDRAQRNGAVRAADEPAATITGALDNGNVRWVQRSNFSAGGDGTTAAERGRTVRHPDEPSVSITGKPEHWATSEAAASSQGSKDAIRISPREAATLQGFRPDFKLFGTLGQQFQGVGNAVPPPLGYALFARVL